MGKEIKGSSIISVLATLISVLATLNSVLATLNSVLATFFKQESSKEGIYTSFFATVGLGIF